MRNQSKTKIKLLKLFCKSLHLHAGLDKLRPRRRSGAVGHVKLLRHTRFSGVHILPCKRKTPIDLQIYSQRNQTMKKFSKY